MRLAILEVQRQRCILDRPFGLIGKAGGLDALVAWGVPCTRLALSRPQYSSAVGLIAAAPASYAAGGGYGSGNGPAGVPGGFANVVATHTFTSDGGSLDANIPGGHAHLTVPAGAFIGALQIAVTAPDLESVAATLPKLGLENYRVVAAIGIGVSDTNGHKFTGTFVHPLTLTITGTGLGLGNQVIQFTGPSTAKAVAAAVSAGTVTLSMLADPDFAVLVPAAASTVASPLATSSAATPSTGAGVLTSSGPPTQVLGETLTRSGRGVSTIGFGVATAALLGALIVAVRRRSAVGRQAYAGKHGPKSAAYVRRHGTRLVTHAPRH